MSLTQSIARALKLRANAVSAAVALLDNGNTIPFIARYRKEQTGGLDEEQLRQIQAETGRRRNLEERRSAVLNAIQDQGQLTPDLEARLRSADNLTALEDLYQPFRPRRRTRADAAREKGLGPLADLILAQPHSQADPLTLAQEHRGSDGLDPEEALAGARDIVAEIIADQAEVRGRVRQKAFRFGQLRASRIPDSDDARGTYRLYYDFELPVARLRPHQVLALNRGEKEKILRVGLVLDEQDWLLALRLIFRPDRRSPLADQLQRAMFDSARRLLLPAIERDVRRQLTEKAEAHAINVFAENLRHLLRQPPLTGQIVMGLDPAYRTGCKVAVVDPTGRLLDTATIYPHQPRKQWSKARATLIELARRHGVTVVAIGNGTASRETERLVAEAIKSEAAAWRYLIVNEAGASVYSASPLAREELPDLDVTLRGAVSIARRLLDPLAELVKIEPRALGVGLYQHDVNQKRLGESLTGVVETVVNQIGVDLNTASAALLNYVSGIGPTLARRIVAYRNEHGPFPDRQALLQVPGLGTRAFEQAAGFLRLPEGVEPLDATAIHPESYVLARKVLALAETSLSAPAAARQTALAALEARVPLADLARQLAAGKPTLADILEQLARPGRDPRADVPPPILRADVLQLADLRPGMILLGTVRNVVDFGAFIDIGVKQDGLLHRSQIPRQAGVSLGDIVQVEIRQIDPERGRISLAWVRPS